ncbi:MAG: NADH-quinone oxidoreductase subunit I [Chloroflexi bacterium]|nr:NADH-quinone oxidoreductase subunit I [Chloroflexota bacterium]MBU1749246.1 NADH-quinone oxidoreductase subunit I [Chloroflexota bacterium]MBU1877670.1 NADH-quinone oxidoreductase subunit I [Chloroflexota bacterium]
MNIPGIGVIKGLRVVLSEMVQTYIRGPFTVQYPEERQEIPERFRGRHVWLYDIDPETNANVPRCVGCLACARACPQGIIAIETERAEDRKRVVNRFNIDLGLCMYCKLCVEACNFYALRMSQVFEMATYNRPSLIWNKDQLLFPADEYARTHPHDPMPAAKEKEATS